MNNVIKLKDTCEEIEYEEMYKSFDYVFENGDVGVYKDEESFWMTVDFGVYKDIDKLKGWCIKSFEECKDYLEEEYGMVNTTKYIYESSVGYEVEYISDAELYAIEFDIPDIKTVNEIYNWICKAIKTIHNLE